MTSDALKWVEPPTFPGAKLAIVQGDPGKEGPFVYRVKMPANYKIAPHYHKAVENVTVLSGAFHVGMGDKFDMKKGETLRVGGFFRAEKDMQHYAWTSAPTMIQIHGRGPFVITYVNPGDDPRNTRSSEKK